MSGKTRLDSLLVKRGLAANQEEAQAYIGAGKVLVDTRADYKAGSLVPSDCEIILKKTSRYVSRGGYKLEKGLSHFELDPAGWICADIGCSNGGFTDCLLQKGAGRVYCVDVGYGILDWKLRQDKKVVVLERTNARYLDRDHIPESLDLAVIDASFISLKQLLPPLLPLFAETVRIVALVKPQFELPRDLVGPGGVVRSHELHEQALAMATRFGTSLGLVSRGSVASPICGIKGNQEFLVYFTSG